MPAIKGKNVRVDDATYDRIHQLAKEEERTLSMIVRRSVLEYWNTNAEYEEERVEPSVEKDTASYL
jgi:predicted transcriptional regulator|tara:strand:- start:861 stop:1058 length:198 start_codon:yes stop_codon:yes gene_type:complete